MTEPPRVNACHRVCCVVPNTICVIWWATAVATMAAATSSASTSCHTPPTATTSSRKASVLSRTRSSSWAFTCSARRSALLRAAIRAARRITVSFPGAPVTATMIRSAVSHTSPFP